MSSVVSGSIPLFLPRASMDFEAEAVADILS